MVEISSSLPGVSAYNFREIISFKVVAKTKRNEMTPFLAGAQPIDDENIVEPAPVQLPNKRASDKARAAGHKDPHPASFAMC